MVFKAFWIVLTMGLKIDANVPLMASKVVFQTAPRSTPNALNIAYNPLNILFAYVLNRLARQPSSLP